METKGFSRGLMILLVVVVIGAVAVSFIFWRKPAADPVPPESILNVNNPQPTVITISSSTSSLSADKKSIIADAKVLLAIDDVAIFNFFKNQSQLCNEANIDNSPERRLFCENQGEFKRQVRFVSIVVSPDNLKVGFTIESDTLAPDKVVGIFYPARTTNKIYFLTGYYLGNEFISFSPQGTNFVYQGSCFEGMCGLFVKDSETLAEKSSINNPEFIDAREKNTTFVRWISENEVEYKLGDQLQRKIF